MRWLLLVISVLPATSLAGPPGASLAPPASVLMKLDADALPDACRDFAKLADTPNRSVALTARISLATCLVDERVKPLVLCDCEQSVIDINTALEPSLGLLDEVFAAGDPTMQVFARKAQGDLLERYAALMLATVPPPVNGSETAAALRTTRLQMLRPLVSPWLVRAHSMFTDLDRIARANPKLETNPSVVAALRAARARLSRQGG